MSLRERTESETSIFSNAPNHPLRQTSVNKAYHSIRASSYFACRTNSPCDGEGVNMLTPGHFLIGRPIKALPNPSFSYRPISLLWQNMVHQFWQCCRQEYLASLRRFAKWHKLTRNINRDIVVLHDGGMVPTQ